MKSSKSPSDNNNQISILNGQKVSITTDVTVDNNDPKNESVQVKSVNYKELIKSSSDDRENNEKNVRSLIKTKLPTVSSSVFVLKVASFYGHQTSTVHLSKRSS